jgi:tRNA(Ile)-lysidine synthase
MQPHSRKLLQKVEQTILSRSMLSKGDRVLAGVSGGPDSVAMLHLLNRLAPAWGLQIGIAHLNHCLRGIESDKDADFVAALAAQLHLPCFIDTIDVQKDSAFQKLSLEAAARTIRYNFFDRIRQQNGYDKIATGHHQNDNAEQMLMFLFRGSGSMGVAGIPPVREGRIIRPLIDTNRNELVAFLNENEIAYKVDDSNRDMRFLRNRIRHETIPYIQACCNPGIIETLNRFSRIVRSENEWMDEIIQTIYSDAIVCTDSHRQVLAIPAFSAFPEAVRRRVIRTAIARTKGDLQRISFSHIEAARELAERRHGLAYLILPDGIRIERKKNQLIFYRLDTPVQIRKQAIQPDQPTFFYSVAGPGEHISIMETGAVMIFSHKPVGPDMLNDLGDNIALLDMEMLKFPLTVRNIRPGDRFTPLGMNGTQKIQKYFIDHKIDRRERTQYPVLLSENQIVWLAGHRIDDHFKVTHSTRTLFKINFFKSAQPELA